jgi:predicted ATPase
MPSSNEPLPSIAGSSDDLEDLDILLVEDSWDVGQAVICFTSRANCAAGTGATKPPAAASASASFFTTALAEAEAKAGELETALATIDAVIAETELRGQRSFESESHRVRGEILLKCDPADAAPAEEAFLTAIAVAQQQKARSFELRAALSLARLYQSTNRHADAHAVLAPALEGFSPTPEFPEVAEAQAHRATLSEMEEVKKEAAP